MTTEYDNWEGIINPIQTNRTNRISDTEEFFDEYYMGFRSIDKMIIIIWVIATIAILGVLIFPLISYLKSAIGA